MGEAGKVTRLLGPLCGSYITFAANGAAQSASGQLNIREMLSFYDKVDNDFINRCKNAIQTGQKAGWESLCATVMKSSDSSTSPSLGM